MLRFFLVILVSFGLSIPQPSFAQIATKKSGSATVGNEVVIGSFTIAFYHVKKDKMTSFEGQMRTMEVALAGLSGADLQAATDRAYENFLVQLQAAGFTVRDREGFRAMLETDKHSPLSQGEQAKMKFGRNKADGRALVFSPTELGAPIVNREHQGLSTLWSGPFAMLKYAGPFLHTESVMKSYSKDNGIAVLNPIYFIDFADFDKYEGISTKKLSADVSLALAADENKVNQSSIQYYGANGKTGLIKLTKPFAVAGDFGRITKRTGPILADGMGLPTKATYTYTVNLASWTDGISRLIGESTPGLIAPLAGK